MSRFQRAVQGGIYIIITLMPFHAFLAVSLGSLFGHQVIIQAWKEILLIGLAGISLWLLTKAKYRQRLKTDATWLIMAFVVLGLIVSLWQDVSLAALAFGAKTDFGFLLIFLLAYLIATKKFNQNVRLIVVTTAALVALFGVMQVLVLPPAFLAGFGYNEGTILPYLGLDSRMRILSTLGGPNQLGSFLILPIAVMLAAIWRQRARWWHWLLLALMSFTLYHTFSRSAWLGVAAALAVIIFISLNQRQRWALVAGGAILLMITITVFTRQVGPSNDWSMAIFVRPTDLERSAALEHGLEKVIKHPLGLGLGATGPASIHAGQADISENYYLQVAIETGWIGLLLFLAIMVSVGRQLYSQRNNNWALALLGSLVGIGVVNLFLHGWADSSTALVWWGSAGAALGAHADV